MDVNIINIIIEPWKDLFVNFNAASLYNLYVSMLWLLRTNTGTAEPILQTNIQEPKAGTDGSRSLSPIRAIEVLE